jgi:hypothetical protein
MRERVSPSGGSRLPWLLVGSLVMAAVASPFAVAAGENTALLGGARNPGANQTQELSRETEIIANTSTYGTRQSNKSENGGGAIYGCRSKEGGTARGQEPCVRANNLSSGLAFEFETDGPLGGTISAAGGDNARPFVTNATGVATGLNADRVDSKSAAELVADAVKAAQALNPFAQVEANGTLGSKRGVASARRTAVGTYEVVFDNDVSSCALTATQSTTDEAGPVGLSVGSDKKTVTVATRSGVVVNGGGLVTAGGAPADKPFHIVATC